MTITFGDVGPSDEISAAALEVWGTDARYFPKDGEPFDLRVIFKAPRKRAIASANGRSESVDASAPFAKAARHVLADARQDETILVAGQIWAVAHVDADGAVWTILRLSGPVPPSEPLP